MDLQPAALLLGPLTHRPAPDTCAGVGRSSRSRIRLESLLGTYDIVNTQTMRTTITVASTATDAMASTEAEIPSNSPTTVGSCNPMSRNANDSRTNCSVFHTAVSCRRVA